MNHFSKKPLVCALLLTPAIWMFAASQAYAEKELVIKFPVTVEKVQVKDVHEWLHVYGRVGFDDAFVQNLNLPYSGQVMRLPMLAGEPVKKGQVLAEIAVDPAVAAAYQQALAGVSFASSEVRRIKKMLIDHLATQSQLSSAEKVLSDNQSQLRQLTAKGFGTSIHVVRAPFDAIVASVVVQAGQRIVAGTTLMQLGHANQLKVILGIEPDDMPHVQSGNDVLLHTGLKDSIHAKVDRVLHTVNAQTRLVDVLVRLHDEQTRNVLPGMTVAAELAGRYFTQAFWVPRSALVQRGGKDVLMQAENGLAHAIPVQVLLEENAHAVVTGQLHKDMLIVRQGVAELHDGDAIQVVQ